MPLPTSFGASLPSWLTTELPDLPTVLATVEERMDLVNDLADRNWRAGTGGPFAAVVVEAATGDVVSVGVNVVLSSRLSVMHAEVTALALAQERTGTWDLGADGVRRQLVANARPCIQCYGAAMWSGARSLVIGADGPEVEAATGFDEGPMPADWVGQFERRGIDVTTGVRHQQALEVLRSFGASDGVVYNARGGAEPS